MKGLVQTTIVLDLVLILGFAPALRSTPQETAPATEESRIMSAISAETEHKRKLDLLHQWEELYPDTLYQERRIRTYIGSYRATGQTEKAIEAAQELLKMRPRDMEAHYVIVSLTPVTGSNNPERQQAAEQSARMILSGDVEKPRQPQTDRWQQAQGEAHKTLGWIAIRNNDHREAQQHYLEAQQHYFEALKLNPNSGEASYGLGSALLSEGNPDKNTRGLFYLARAATYDGEGSLTPKLREAADRDLSTAYKNYMGAVWGLDQLKQKAKLQAFPPTEFRIEPPRKVLARTGTGLLLLLCVSGALFAAAVAADRTKWPETLVKWLFNAGGLCLLAIVASVILMIDIVIRGVYFDIVFFNYEGLAFEGLAELWRLYLGGWTRQYAAFSFSIAGTTFVMAVLAEYFGVVDAEFGEFYAVIFVGALAVGIVLSIGIAFLVETLAVLLGIVSTVIAILLGVKKLTSEK